MAGYTLVFFGLFFTHPCVSYEPERCERGRAEKSKQNQSCQPQDDSMPTWKGRTGLRCALLACATWSRYDDTVANDSTLGLPVFSLAVGTGHLYAKTAGH